MDCKCVRIPWVKGETFQCGYKQKLLTFRPKIFKVYNQNMTENITFEQNILIFFLGVLHEGDFGG